MMKRWKRLKGIFCVFVNDSNWLNHSFHSQQFQLKPDYQLGSIMNSFVPLRFAAAIMMRWVQLLSCVGNCETLTKHFFCPFIFTAGSFLTNLTRHRSYGAIRRSGEESAKKLRQDLRENTKHADSQPRHRFRFVTNIVITPGAKDLEIQSSGLLFASPKKCLIFYW